MATLAFSLVCMMTAMHFYINIGSYTVMYKWLVLTTYGIRLSILGFTAFTIPKTKASYWSLGLFIIVSLLSSLFLGIDRVRPGGYIEELTPFISYGETRVEHIRYHLAHDFGALLFVLCFSWIPALIAINNPRWKRQSQYEGIE